MIEYIEIGGKRIGYGHPCFVIAEIGINHNGDIDLARKLIDVAVIAGCDAVKFQKRTPEICVPEEQKNIERDTPWGRLTYLEYRHRVEFGEQKYKIIDQHCKDRGIMWTASCWDMPALKFIENFNPNFYKVPSAALTNEKLLLAYKAKGRPLIISTGMSTMEQIKNAAEIFGDDIPWMFLQCTSTYPVKHEEVNLRAMDTLRQIFKRPVGYSGHEVGLQISIAAAALGADVIERHITLDRAMWGSDQAASVEPGGLIRLMRDIRVVEQALGNGIKKVYEDERPLIERLRLRKR